MNFRTLLLIFVISVAIFLSHTRVEATKVLCEDFASPNHLETYSTVYEKAKYTMAGWLQRLPSGPSNGGSGH
uniref:Transmembrane protein n=1 Tax=Fagus sylvatica TaxID=28930 RepID=A0A2N9ER14_FAGSY